MMHFDGKYRLEKSRINYTTSREAENIAILQRVLEKWGEAVGELIFTQGDFAFFKDAHGYMLWRYDRGGRADTWFCTCAPI